MATKNLTVRLLGDVKSFSRAFRDAEGATGKFNTAANQLKRNAGLAFAAVGAAAVKSFSSVDAGYDAIVVGTGATGEALDGLKDSANSVAKEVPNSFAEVGQAVADVNTRLGLTGEPLEEMTKRFLDLSRITGTDVSTNIANVTRLFGDWSVEAEDQAETLDLVFAASQQTGIGIDQLTTSVVQFGAPMRQLGFSLEESIALFGKFEKEGVNTEAVMSGLRMGLGRMAKAGEEPIETFQRIIEEIKEAGTQGEANAISLEAFGQRAGPDMAAAIREGRFELDDLLDSLSNTEGSLDRAVEDTNSFTDSLGRIKNTVLVSAAPALERFAEGVEDIADAVEASKLPELIDLLGQVQDQVNEEPDGAGGFFRKAAGFAASSFPKMAREFGSAWKGLFDDISGGSDEATESLISWETAAKRHHGRLKETTEAAEDATEAAEDNSEAMDDRSRALMASSEAEETMGRRTRDATRRLDEQRDAARELRDAHRDLAGDLLTVREGEIRLARSIRDTTAKLGEQEEQAGDHELALIDLVREADGLAQSQVELKGTTLESKSGMNTWTQSMLNSAAKMDGPLKRAVLRHIAHVNGIPEDRITEFIAQAEAGSVWTATQVLNMVANPRTAYINAVAVGVANARAAIGSIGRGLFSFDSGGVVPGPRGAPTLIEAHGGETVLPTHKSSGAGLGGGTYNITVNAGMGTNGADVGRQVVDAIKRFEQGNGPGWRS